jgi:nucleolar protein 15
VCIFKPSDKSIANWFLSGATDASPKPKKQKKSSDTVAPKKHPVKSVKPVIALADDVPVKAKASRKQSKDMLAEDVKDEVTAEKKSKKKGKTVVNGDADAVVGKPKKSKKTATAEEEAPAPEVIAEASPKEKSKKSRRDKSKDKVHAEEAISAATESKKSKKDKKSKAHEALKEPSPEPEDQESESDEEEEDDQTAALLAGFESDRDESDVEKDDEGLDADNFKDRVPKGLLTKVKAASGNEQKPGVIFVGYVERFHMLIPIC